MTDKMAFITERMNDPDVKQRYPRAEDRRAYCEELWAAESGAEATGSEKAASDKGPDKPKARAKARADEKEVTPEPDGDDPDQDAGADDQGAEGKD